MTENVVIDAQKRTVKGKQVGALRRQGLLPGVIYGRIGKEQIEPIAIQLDLHNATQIIKKLTGSSLVTLDVEGEKYPAILREIQKDIIIGTLLHVDFMAVSMSEKLHTAVSIELIGQAPAEINLAAVVVTGISELEISCLPQDLPERIEVDATILTDFDSAIYVKDLVLPDAIEILTDPDELIAGVTYVAMEEEEEEEEVEGELADLLEEGAEPEVIEKGKREDGFESEED
jgi:large subunit ribosomal protein L25